MKYIVNIWTGHHVSPSCQSSIQVGGEYTSIFEIVHRFQDPTIQTLNILDARTGVLLAQYVRKDGTLQVVKSSKLI